MKKLFLAVFAAVLFSSSFAQDQQQNLGNQVPQKNFKQNVYAQLNLTPEQQEKMKSVNADFKKQMKDLRQQHQQNLKAILTPDQQKKMDEMVAQRKAMAKGKMMEKMQQMKTQLGLTDEQQKQFETLRTNMQAKIKEAMQNKSLTPEQRQQAIKAARQEFKSQSKQVLTPDQLQKFQSMRGGNKGNNNGDNDNQQNNSN